MHLTTNSHRVVRHNKIGPRMSAQVKHDRFPVPGDVRFSTGCDRIAASYQEMTLYCTA